MNRLSLLSDDERWREILVTVLSLSAVRHGRRKLPIRALPSLFETLRREFPEALPTFDVAELPDQRFSRTLALAWKMAEGEERLWQSATGANLEIQPHQAEHNLKLMEKRYGELWIRRYEPVADRLDEMILDHEGCSG